MKITESIFKAYDIRGISGVELTAEVAEAVGRSVADVLPDAGPVIVGRDMRTDSDELAEAVIRGLVRQGRDVWDIGLSDDRYGVFWSRAVCGRGGRRDDGDREP